MEFKVKVSTIYACSLERAFKTPMLCDISKVHTGFIVMPAITHCTGDEHWGKPGYSKTCFAAKSLLFGGGEVSSDTVLERVENQYWKIQVADFKMNMIGFTRFVGEWQTTEVAPGQVRIDYTYALHADMPVLYPLNWLFAKTFWRIYMGRVLENIRRMAYHEEPYQYD